MIERPGQQRPRTRLQAENQRSHPLGGGGLLRCRRVAAHALGMARRARGVDHVGRLRDDRPLIGRLIQKPGFEVEREVRLCQLSRIDGVMGEDFRRGRHAQHGHARRNRLAQLMQHVGVGDQHRRARVLQNVFDLLRLEVPVDGHAVGAEPHRRIGRLDEGDVVAHENGDAVALLQPETMQPAGNARRAAGDLVMRAPAFAGDDAEEGLGGFHYWFPISRRALDCSSFRDGPKDQTRNLEIPGSMLRIAPE